MQFPFQGERATGYGVALLNVLFGKFSASKLLRNACPPDRVENGSGDEQNKSKKKRTEWRNREEMQKKTQKWREEEEKSLNNEAEKKKFCHWLYFYPKFERKFLRFSNKLFLKIASKLKNWNYNRFISYRKHLRLI